jgi:hypothetical protein
MPSTKMHNMNPTSALRSISVAASILAIGILCAVCSGSNACTIFVLAHSNHAFFFNNEDWSNPVTRIWFAPVGANYFAAVYVGFDNGWAQGGMNSEGLAFDWVAGFNDKWEPAPTLLPVRGNPSQRMLETCASLDQAIAFYRANRETSFSYARIFVADCAGGAAIIGAKDGQLHIEKVRQCGGFGYGQSTLDAMLERNSEVTLQNGLAILDAARQKGKYATKYSNAFDLKTGDIHICRFDAGSKGTVLNFATETQKGPHYYDIPKIARQVTEPPRPLLRNMRRFPMDEFKPITDPEPKTAERIVRILRDGQNGAMNSEDYTAKLWEELSPKQKEIQNELEALGEVISIARVESQSSDEPRSYRYRIQFRNALVLQRFTFDKKQKLASIQSEDVERSSGK